MKKKLILLAGGLGLSLSFGAQAAVAQTGSVAKGPDPEMVKDLESEKSALHELGVARHYFKMKKAYVAAFKRTEELIAGYPEFSRLDEALYIAGMSSLYLSEGKGKQAVPKSPADKAQEFTPEVLRGNARLYLARLVKEFPESKFRKDAEEALKAVDSRQ